MSLKSINYVLTDLYCTNIIAIKKYLEILEKKHTSDKSSDLETYNLFIKIQTDFHCYLDPNDITKHLNHHHGEKVTRLFIHNLMKKSPEYRTMISDMNMISEIASENVSIEDVLENLPLSIEMLNRALEKLMKSIRKFQKTTQDLEI